MIDLLKCGMLGHMERLSVFHSYSESLTTGALQACYLLQVLPAAQIPLSLASRRPEGFNKQNSFIGQAVLGKKTSAVPSPRQVHPGTSPQGEVEQQQHPRP